MQLGSQVKGELDLVEVVVEYDMTFVMKDYCFSLCEALLDVGFFTDDPHLIEPFYYFEKSGAVKIIIVLVKMDSRFSYET